MNQRKPVTQKMAAEAQVKIEKLKDLVTENYKTGISFWKLPLYWVTAKDQEVTLPSLIINARSPFAASPPPVQAACFFNSPRVVNSTAAKPLETYDHSEFGTDVSSPDDNDDEDLNLGKGCTIL